MACIYVENTGCRMILVPMHDLRHFLQHSSVLSWMQPETAQATSTSSHAWKTWSKTASSPPVPASWRERKERDGYWCWYKNLHVYRLEKKDSVKKRPEEWMCLCLLRIKAGESIAEELRPVQEDPDQEFLPGLIKQKWRIENCLARLCLGRGGENLRERTGGERNAFSHRFCLNKQCTVATGWEYKHHLQKTSGTKHKFYAKRRSPNSCTFAQEPALNAKDN